MQNIIYSFIESFTGVSLAFLVDRWYFKKNISFWKYFIIFMVFFIGLLIPFSAKAEEPKFETEMHTGLNAQLEIEHLQLLQYDLMSDQHRRQYTKAMQLHLRDGARCLSDAKSRCIYLPRNDREYTYNAIFTCVGALASGEPRATFVVALGITITQYFLDICGEVKVIYDLIQEAQYHYEMADYFESVLTNPNA